MGKSKIIYGGEVLIDLTADTVAPGMLLKGVTAHGADGELITGSCNYDSYTGDATAGDAEILSGKTAYVKGTKKTGTMPNNGGINGGIGFLGIPFNIPQGYHDGSGKVDIAESEKAKIIPSNIRKGVTILGVTGDMSNTEGANPQSKTVTPSATQQSIIPDAGYNFLSEVIVMPIPYVESENDAGGITVTIG